MLTAEISFKDLSKQLIKSGPVPKLLYFRTDPSMNTQERFSLFDNFYEYLIVELK